LPATRRLSALLLEQRGRELPSVGLRQGVFVAEDAEDVEDRDPCFLLLRSPRPNDDEKVVERRLELALGGERLGEIDACVFVRSVYRQSRLEFGEIQAAGRLQPGGRLETVDFGVGGETTEDDHRLIGLATVDQHGGKNRAGFGLVGLPIEDLAEDVLRGDIVVGEEGSACLIHHDVEFGGENPLDPLANCRFGERTCERVGDLAVPKSDDHRDALHAVLGGKLLVGVDVDLDEFEGASGFRRDLLEDRSQDKARLTPCGPEVHDDRNLTAAPQHFLREIGRVDILHKVAGSGHRDEVTGGSPATVAVMEIRPNAPFGQVLTAVITPFGEDGSTDYGTFWRLTRYLAKHGSDGIVVGGTTGESPTLSKVEKVALFKAAVDAVGDRITVIAGTGTYDTRESVELTQRAAESGVHGVMAVTPYYSKPPQEGIARHFSAIADATDLPVLLYNIPGRTCRIIEIETLVRLAEHERIVAVKDAVDDLDFTRRQMEALPEGFAVYSGSDVHTREIIRAGGVGVVSVAAHLAGDTIKAMVEAAISGDDEEADRLDVALAPLIEALFLEPNPMPLKAGLNLAWDPVGEPRLPLIPASDDTRDAVGRALAALGEA
jgi:4-hydroxy-tetrahydrodipicolinate synthase